MDADAWTPATQAGVGAVRMAARRDSSGVQARSNPRLRVVSVDPVTPGQRGAQSRRRRPLEAWVSGRFEPAWLTHAIVKGLSPRRGMAVGMTADGAQRNVFPNLWNDAEMAGCRPAGRMQAAPLPSQEVVEEF
jgi:hypothetical protein